MEIISKISKDMIQITQISMEIMQSNFKCIKLQYHRLIIFSKIYNHLPNCYSIKINYFIVIIIYSVNYNKIRYNINSKDNNNL